LSERYPYWFWIALYLEIGVSRFYLGSWSIWAMYTAVALFIGMMFSSILAQSWVRDSIRSGVETSVADAASWPDVTRRRYAWTRNVSLSAALFIVSLPTAFEAFARHH